MELGRTLQEKATTLHAAGRLDEAIVSLRRSLEGEGDEAQRRQQQQQQQGGVGSTLAMLQAVGVRRTLAAWLTSRAVSASMGGDGGSGGGGTLARADREEALRLAETALVALERWGAEPAAVLPPTPGGPTQEQLTQEVLRLRFGMLLQLMHQHLQRIELATATAGHPQGEGEAEAAEAAAARVEQCGAQVLSLLEAAEAANVGGEAAGLPHTEDRRAWRLGLLRQLAEAYTQAGAAAVAAVLAAVLTEIYLCGVCSRQEILRRHGRGQGWPRRTSDGVRAWRCGAAQLVSPAMPIWVRMRHWTRAGGVWLEFAGGQTCVLVTKSSKEKATTVYAAVP
jgi:hypothetical protein